MSGQDYLNIWVKQWLWHFQVSFTNKILANYTLLSTRYLIKSEGCYPQSSLSRKYFEVDSGRFRVAQVPTPICCSRERFELSTFKR
jgi:hypothetical protein